MKAKSAAEVQGWTPAALGFWVGDGARQPSRSQDSGGFSRRFRQTILPRHRLLRGHLQARHTLRRRGISGAHHACIPESETRRRYGLRDSIRITLSFSFIALVDALAGTIPASILVSERPRNLDVETIVRHEKPIVPTVEFILSFASFKLSHARLTSIFIFL